MAAAAAKAADHDRRRDHTLDSIAGHDLPKRLVGTMIELDRLPHALLLVGPEGVGKMSFAWALGKELLWHGLHGEKAGEEGETRRLRLNSRVSRENTHPDVFTIEPTGALRQIQVDTLRDFEDNHAWIGPVEGRTKLCVIENAHAMNVAAANCFLKLLEEPPPHLKFLLTTDAPTEMLTTVKSRCAVVPFHPLAEAELVGWLQTQRPDAAAPDVERAARLAEGRPGRALELLEGADATKPVLDALTRLDREGFARLFATASELSSRPDGGPVAATLVDLIALYRDAMLYGLGEETGGDGQPVGATEREALRLFPEHEEALAALGRHGPAAAMAALDILTDEVLHRRQMFHKELHLEGVLSRIGVAIRPHRRTDKQPSGK